MSELSKYEIAIRCMLVATRKDAYCDLESLPPEYTNPETTAIKRDIISKAGEEVRMIISLLVNDPAELFEIGRLKRRSEWALSQSAIKRFLRIKRNLNYKQIPCVMQELREVFCQLVSV